MNNLNRVFNGENWRKIFFGGFTGLFAKESEQKGRENTLPAKGPESGQGILQYEQVVKNRPKGKKRGQTVALNRKECYNIRVKV